MHSREISPLVRIFSLYTNIERVREEFGGKYWPVGDTSMAYTLVDLGFSKSTSEILLVIDFYLK